MAREKVLIANSSRGGRYSHRQGCYKTTQGPLFQRRSPKKLRNRKFKSNGVHEMDTWTNNKFDVKIYLNISSEKLVSPSCSEERGLNSRGRRKKWLDVRGSARAQALLSRVEEEGVKIQAPRTTERKESGAKAWKGETSVGEAGW